jgi:hypothetical protein
MCDFCGTTSRTSGETSKIELPRSVVPEALHPLASNVTAPKITVDACRSCEGELAELLDAFLVRRFASGQAPGGAQ